MAAQGLQASVGEERRSLWGVWRPLGFASGFVEQPRSSVTLFQPRDGERGGTFGQGKVVRTYAEGQVTPRSPILSWIIFSECFSTNYFDWWFLHASIDFHEHFQSCHPLTFLSTVGDSERPDNGKPQRLLRVPTLSSEQDRCASLGKLHG